MSESSGMHFYADFTDFWWFSQSNGLLRGGRFSGIVFLFLILNFHYTIAEGCSLEKKFAEKHFFLMFDVEFVC